MEPLVRTLVIIARDHVSKRHLLADAVLAIISPFLVFFGFFFDIFHMFVFVVVIGSVVAVVNVVG